MMRSQFKAGSYSCGDSRMYPTQGLLCEIPGSAILEVYGYSVNGLGHDIGIMLAIILGYRLLAWLVTLLKK